MCLHRIVRTFSNTKHGVFPSKNGDFPGRIPRIGFGYKITSMDFNSRRRNPYHSIDEDFFIKSNQWYIAKQEIVQTESGYWYPSGFHIFLRLKDAIIFSKKLSGCYGNTIELISYQSPICAGFERKRTVIDYVDIPTVVCEKILFHYPVVKFYPGKITVYENRSSHNV